MDIEVRFHQDRPDVTRPWENGDKWDLYSSLAEACNTLQYHRERNRYAILRKWPL
jgi:hypothetical protein